MASATPDIPDVITKSLLKNKSGEFDVESIHTLCLNGLGISDLGCISECTALESLDLSLNDVTRLHKLAGLNSLHILNLSANRISSLDGLQSLENLENLNISGNLIGSVDSLRSLSSLEKLTHLRLKDDIKGLSNPVCNSNYVDDVLFMLPALHTLDGQRVRGKGSDLFLMCQSIDKKLNVLEMQPVNVQDLPASDRQSDLMAQQWMVDADATDKVNEAEEQLNAMLEGCRSLYKDTMKKIEEEHQTKGL